MYGAVAAPDLRSAEAGAAMLRAGGNAVDAAVAAVFTSFVVEFSVVNPMGGGFATVVGAEGDAELLDFFLNAPGRPPFEGQDFRPIDVDWGESVQRFHVGRASAAVPGCVPGLCHLAERRGRLPLSDVLEPAIRHAREGFVVAPFAARALELLEGIFRSDPSCETLFAPEGRLLRAGDRLVLDALGETFEVLAREGATLFTTGSVAPGGARGSGRTGRSTRRRGPGGLPSRRAGRLWTSPSGTVASSFLRRRPPGADRWPSPCSSGSASCRRWVFPARSGDLSWRRSFASPTRPSSSGSGKAPFAFPVAGLLPVSTRTRGSVIASDSRGRGACFATSATPTWATSRRGSGGA